MMDSFFRSLGIGNFFIIFTLLVMVHELGHYALARLCGVRVLRFSIGLGPKIFSWVDKKKTEWRLAWLPLGGYVSMLGEMIPIAQGSAADSNAAATKGAAKKQPLVTFEKLPAADLPYAFHKKSVGQRALIIAAGPMANFIFSLLLLIAMAMTFGMPSPKQASGRVVVDTVMKDSAAAKAGIKLGDQIIAINNSKVITPQDIVSYMTEVTNGAAITLTVVGKVVDAKQGDGGQGEATAETNSKSRRVVITPDKKQSLLGSDHYRLGVGLRDATAGLDFKQLSFGQAIVYGSQQTWNMMTGIVGGIKQLMVQKGALEQMGGPVMIAKMSWDVGKEGVYAVLGFMALLSINLGIFNLLPIPVLDGGQLLFLAIEKLWGRPLPAKLQQVVTLFFVLLLIGFFLLVSAKDIFQLFIR